MRKYFLLSAVALLATSTANATTDYAEVTAKATIEVAGTFECIDKDWGKIVVKQNNEEFKIDTNGETTSADLISANGDGFIYCDGTNEDASITIEDAILTNQDTNKTIYMDVSLDGIDSTGTQLSSSLTIPSGIVSGEYTGSFTVTRTY